MTRKLGVIVLCVDNGDVNAARRVVGKAIRKALKVRKWLHGEHFVSYLTKREAEWHDIQPRYTFYATEEEFNAVCDLASQMFEKDGWEGMPIDCYHD